MVVGVRGCVPIPPAKSPRVGRHPRRCLPIADGSSHPRPTDGGPRRGRRRRDGRQPPRHDVRTALGWRADGAAAAMRSGFIRRCRTGRGWPPFIGSGPDCRTTGRGSALAHFCFETARAPGTGADNKCRARPPTWSRSESRRASCLTRPTCRPATNMPAWATIVRGRLRRRRLPSTPRPPPLVEDTSAGAPHPPRPSQAGRVCG